jgi:hypothetical protein
MQHLYLILFFAIPSYCCIHNKVTRNPFAFSHKKIKADGVVAQIIFHDQNKSYDVILEHNKIMVQEELKAP